MKLTLPKGTDTWINFAKSLRYWDNVSQNFMDEYNMIANNSGFFGSCLGFFKSLIQFKYKRAFN